VYARHSDPKAVEGRVFQSLQDLISLRKTRAVFAGGDLDVILTENVHVLGYTRLHKGDRAVVFANFSESEQVISAKVIEQNSLAGKSRLFGGSDISPQGELVLKPLEFVVFG
ncbi:MAG: hypothetical protein WBL25_01280, partial [Anaerolineales bacterium]